MIGKKSQKYWKDARKYILHGNMLLSKHPKIHLPGSWPTYFKKAQDCWIWDLDNNKYLDLYSMGIGTNILGYQNKRVDAVVKKIVNSSNMSTLNCPEEVLLAKKLVSMHRWSNMVKFCRTGAEASAIALRISKSFTCKDKIAFCGYHGWHDWYLSANLTKKNTLGKDHLKNLSTIGVTKKLKGQVFNFKYNDYEALKKLIRKEKIGTVIMEVERNIKPKNNFLKKIRSITKKNKVILIFDECTSAFRETYGGLHKKYRVNPDIAIFGKALGNGYAINAVIGSKKVMMRAKNSFMSSTFWSERIGPSAAIATLNEMRRLRSWEYISKLGKYIKDNWHEIAKKNKLEINISGLSSICSFTFKKNNQLLKTFITQEFLKKNILASNTIYVSTKHNKKNLKKYFVILDKIFKKIKKLEEKNKINKTIVKNNVSVAKFEMLN